MKYSNKPQGYLAFERNFEEQNSAISNVHYSPNTSRPSHITLEPRNSFPPNFRHVPNNISGNWLSRSFVIDNGLDEEIFLNSKASRAEI